VVDKTAPTATATVTPTPNANGWVKTAATVTLSAADEVGGSGLASLSLGSSTGTTSPLTSNYSTDGTTVVPYSATDVAGNTTSGDVTVRVDTTAPTITIFSPADGAVVPQGMPTTASYTCGDATSGVASCTGSIPNGGAIDTSTPGTKTFTVTATDLAGNTTTATRSIIVPPNTTPAPAHDHVTLAFSGGLTAHYDADLNGQVTLTRTNGLITSASAIGTVPGAAGGTATVRINVQRFRRSSLFVGSITVIDPSTHLTQTTVILGNLTATGSTVTGSNTWFTKKLVPYTVTWTITDAG
jgi:hypothetical protein